MNAKKKRMLNSGSNFSCTKPNPKPAIVTSSPAVDKEDLSLLSDNKMFSDISAVGTDITSFVGRSQTGQSQGKRIEKEKLAQNLSHARYVQSIFLDGTIHRFNEQYKKNEVTYLAQLSTLISDLSDHNAYLERMLMAAKHQKKMKDVIQQQDKCLTDLKLCLERNLSPFKSLADMLDHTRHILQFRNVALTPEGISKFSTQLTIAEKLMLKIVANFQSCNLTEASNSYQQIETTLEKELDLLKQCKCKTYALESAVIQISSLKLSD